MCLMRGITEKDPKQGGPKGHLKVPEWAELWRKKSQRGLLITRYQRLEKKKDSDRAIIHVAETVHVLAPLAPPGSPQPK